MAKRLLVVNIYYAPQSFGGATIVAEELAMRLGDDYGWNVSAFTSMRAALLPDFSIRRYRAKGADVLAVSVPSGFTYLETYYSPRMRECFEEVLNVINPDVVHFHSIQTLGADLFDALTERSIPFVVTLHDCWWLCERQFMIDYQGKYCFQQKISQERCKYCVGDHVKSEKRAKYLMHQLTKADMMLFPSEFHRQLYLSNGVDESKAFVNKNGIRFPDRNYEKARKKYNKVVFGFTGGPGPIKGSDLIVQALNSIKSNNYILKLVDAAKIIGSTWINYAYWDIPGEIQFVPAYTQDSMDKFFGSIDVLLFPSQWMESYGLTVREALARDVWVIATDAGGVSEDLWPGKNSTVIPLDGDYRKLADAIAACLDKSLWRSYKNPYKSDLVSYDDQARELDSFFQDVVA